MRKIIQYSFILLLSMTGVKSQSLRSMTVNEALFISSFKGPNGQKIKPEKSLPLLSYEVSPPRQLDKKQYFNSSVGSPLSQIEINTSFEKSYKHGVKGIVSFKNTSNDTLWLTNVLPFEPSENEVYITGIGDHWLSRTYLFRPGFDAVNVIVPDNAWELGFNELSLGINKICALTRRDVSSIKNGKRRRFETILYPGGSVQYTLYADIYQGKWQEGLRLMFQDRMLYDIEPGTFNNSLFERDDLKWVRHAYLNQALMAWDHYFYDTDKNRYTIGDFIEMNNRAMGGAEIYGLWPTWPMLGMDARNQWDMFRSMPGGIDKLNEISGECHLNNSKLFISFNPWDTSTRYEDPYEGMKEMVKVIDSDGVVLDCSGASSQQLRDAADGGKRGVVLKSEGMPVPKDMQGIVSGRVHNALYYAPMLNLNKLIKPDFAIFRVVEVGKERIKREYNLSLFNGYGTENNLYSPGRPYWLDEQWKHLAKILMIQRENAHNFTDFNYTPLIRTQMDHVFVNRWPKKDKTIYTIFSLRPEGIFDPLFEVTTGDQYHYIDLWNHDIANIERIDDKSYVIADVDAFSKKWIGTNNESAVGAIAMFKKNLNTKFNLADDRLTISAKDGDKIRIWAGMPGYTGTYKDYSIQKQSVYLLDEFGRSEGKFVVQLFRDNQLIDENIINFKPASARRISRVENTKSKRKTPLGMVKIPAGRLDSMKIKEGDSFIPYPQLIESRNIKVKSFYMDQFPVTNIEYKKFLDETNYRPEDNQNFLKHWENGIIVNGDENKPVIYVSLDDAKAYTKWAGKRLPTEIEWQYAAQAGDSNLEWPWGNSKGIEKENIFVTNNLTVEKFIGVDPDFANPGNGQYEAVGLHPKGTNPFGLQDLVGSVWQMTNDVYDNVTNTFIILKGGSYFKPESSWWYVQGGPQSLFFRQKLLMVSRGFDRKATVGFRCVADR